MEYQPIWMLTVVLWLQVFGLVATLISLVGVKKDYLEITPIPRGLDITNHK